MNSAINQLMLSVTIYLRSLGPWRSMNSKWGPMLKREVTRLVIYSLWLYDMYLVRVITCVCVVEWKKDFVLGHVTLNQLKKKIALRWMAEFQLCFFMKQIL